MEKKYLWCVMAALAAAAACAAAGPAAPAAAAGPAGRDERAALLLRSERAAPANNKETCRYSRGSWSECDPKSNVRSRTLTLKKGDPASCERTKTIQKKCKKACRYEKAAWSECSAGGEMSRTDQLKPNSDPACEPSRRLTKKCNKNKSNKPTKDKGRRNRQ